MLLDASPCDVSESWGGGVPTSDSDQSGTRFCFLLLRILNIKSSRGRFVYRCMQYFTQEYILMYIAHIHLRVYKVVHRNKHSQFEYIDGYHPGDDKT